MNPEKVGGSGRRLRVVLVGNGPLFHALARGVLADGHQLVGVVTADRGTNPGGAPRLARKGVNTGRVLRRLRHLALDLVLVGSWPEKLGPDLLALPRLGCVNCHPSLLPSHRGPNPYLSSIVAGEPVTGVTFHKMTERWDAGPILLQREVPIERDDTGGSLRERCAGVAEAMVPGLLGAVAAGQLEVREQDETRASYFPALRDRDLEIDWRQPARRIHDRIRGVRPWAHCYSHHVGQRVELEGSNLVEVERGTERPGQVLVFGDSGEVQVACGTPGTAVRVAFRGGRSRPPHAGDRLGGAG